MVAGADGHQDRDGVAARQPNTRSTPLRQAAGSSSQSLYYSERSVRGMIRQIEEHLCARNRAQTVAKSIGLGLDLTAGPG